MTTKTEKSEAVPVNRTFDRFVKHESAARFHPWNMLEVFRGEMDDFFRGARSWPTFPVFPAKRTAEERTTWLPSTDVYRTNGDLIVRADMPGLRKEDVEVLVEDGFLVIKGERKEEKEEKEKEYFRSERSYGSFYRRVPLPEDFDADKISAKVHDGIVEVKVPLPATETKEAKKIAVS